MRHHLALAPLALVSVFPLWWMLTTALRGEAEIYSPWPWPAAPTLENFRFVIASTPVWRLLGNTLAYATLSTAIQLLTATLAAFAFARWRFPFDRTLHALFALSWLVPFQVVMIPNYVAIARLGLIDTLGALLLPHIASALAVLMLVQAMRSFPRDVIEAAQIDGASHWRLLWRIIVPNLRAPLAALAILLFISAWNEYFWPLLLTRTPRSAVIQIGIQSFLTEEGNLWGPLMAMSSMACAPVLLIYVALQRQVIDSFLKAGTRG